MQANASTSSKSAQDLYNTSAERAVLACCLCDRDMIATVSPVIGESDFTIHAHKLIYRAILNLWKRREPADLVLVIDELKRSGDLDAVGFEPAVSELITDDFYLCHANYYTSVVAHYSARRRFADAGQETVNVAYDGGLDLDELRERAGAALQAAGRMAGVSGAESIADIVSMLHDAPADWTRTLLPTGIRPLDARIAGFMPGQLVIVAARPGMGKSAFASQVALYTARSGRAVAFISLEMDKGEVVGRMVSHVVDVDMHRAHTGQAYHDAHLTVLTEGYGRLAELPIRIFAASGGLGKPGKRPPDDIGELVAVARQEMHERPFALLVVDYIGLMKAGGSADKLNRAQELGVITRELKLLAGELGIVVMGLAQLNRAIDSRRGGDAWPVLSDLRDSGAVEQDADIVIFLHRADKDKPQTRCDVAKHRNGPVGFMDLDFVAERTLFTEQRRG